MRRCPRKDDLNAGFSLLELMTALAVAAILASVAVPNLRTFIQNNRLSGASNDLLRSLQLARTEALKRGGNVVVCATLTPAATAPTCSGGSFSTGWIVFQDTDSNWDYKAGEPMLERHAALDSSLTVKADGAGTESYGASGFANNVSTPKTPTHNVLVCDIRGNVVTNNISIERAVLIAQTGRVRVSTAQEDVSKASLAAGACPN